MNKHKKPILVLDDDPDIGMMIKIILEHYGYSVTVTERAEKAAELMQQNNFALLIMDMLLSGANGVDICSRLKKDTRFSQIPVLMISAHCNAKDLCLNAGAEDFIAKPFDMKEMILKIDHLIAV